LQAKIKKEMLEGIALEKKIRISKYKVPNTKSLAKLEDSALGSVLDF